MQKKVFIYLKVSKPSLLHVQEQVLTKYCKQNDWQVVKASTDQEEMLEAAKGNEVDIVLVDSFTRISKDNAEIERLIDKLALYNVILVSLTESENIEGMN